MNAYDIIIQPWLTEKSMELGQHNKDLSSLSEEVLQKSKSPKRLRQFLMSK